MIKDLQAAVRLAQDEARGKQPNKQNRGNHGWATPQAERSKADRTAAETSSAQVS